jgi:hypothetical protein
MDSTEVVIICDGGLIQDVLSNTDVKITVIDYDLESYDENCLTDIPQSDGSKEKAYVYLTQAELNPERVSQLVAASK